MGLFIDASSLPGGFGGNTQVIFLGAVYSFILYNASNLIADGSELLLLIPAWENLIGSIVLPILGAVPDGAMVLFSGLGDNAAEEIGVGVGTLAGSTIMLLTIPYAISIYNGLVPTRLDGSPDYSKKAQPLSSIWLGATGNTALINKSGAFMAWTSLSYFIVQIPASYLLWRHTTSKLFKVQESGFILFSCVFCLVMFISYIYTCYSDSTAPSHEVARTKWSNRSVKLLKTGIMSLEQSFELLLEDFNEEENAIMKGRQLSFVNPLLHDEDPAVEKFKQQLISLMRPLFEEVDMNKDGSIQYEEAHCLLTLFKAGDTADVREMFESYDKDTSGGLDLHEFCDMIWNYIREKQRRQKVLQYASEMDNVETEASEEHEIPEEFLLLEPSKRHSKIINRAFAMLITGTLLVIIFSEPMVAVLNELGSRSGIPSFYLAFVVAPLASNAAEAIASTQFSCKKTEQTMGVSLSALVGAAIMNNTFCLLVFLLLTYLKNLRWTFGPEVYSILLVEGAMLFMTQKQYYTMKDAVLILSLYPASLVLVSILK